MNNMSEDETIQILQQQIERDKYNQEYANKYGYTYNILGVNKRIKAIETLLDLYQKEKEKNKKIETQRQNGTLSDGFHTFNDLYYQRCILFATICNLNKNIAWKSKNTMMVKNVSIVTNGLLLE